jgi:hypothetical protein
MNEEGKGTFPMEKGNAIYMNTDWVPPSLAALLASAGGWFLSWRIFQASHDAATDAELKASKEATAREAKETVEREDGLRLEFRDLRADFREGIDELRKAMSDQAAWRASQDTVNLYTSEALKGIVATQEKHADKLNDHAATLKLVTELLTRDQNNPRRAQ